jgi:two-component system, NtrC family, sensor kinase
MAKVAPRSPTPRKPKSMETASPEDPSVALAWLRSRITELEAELDHRAETVMRLEAELAETRSRLVHADERATIGQLTAGVAHEIKNPLNFVKNFAAISVQLADDLGNALRELGGVRERVGDEEIWELLQQLQVATHRVVEHGRRADAVVTGMMLRARQGPPAPEQVDLNSIVEECCSLALHGAQSGGDPPVRIERQLAAGLPTLLLDPHALRRVFINLLNNAVDSLQSRAAAERNGFVPILKVSTAVIGGEVEVRISDNGSGISPEVEARLFEPFFTTKPVGRGTGLGLAMSRGLITDQGGRIQVESVPGQGADFIVTFPLPD